MNDGSQYDIDYFLHGRETEKSLYENYSWIPQLTIPMVGAIINHLRIGVNDTILDFGCARGYVVKAFREIGYRAFGADISKWAIANCDPEVSNFVGNGFPLTEFDWIIAKDVLEHIQYVDATISRLMPITRKGMFVVVPLSLLDGRPYAVPEYENDVTHIHRLTLATWASYFMHPGWTVEASYQVKGVKDNYSHYDYGNGFIVARRVKV